MSSSSSRSAIGSQSSLKRPSSGGQLWFYPLLLAVAALLILASMGASVFERAATPQPATIDGAQLAWGPKALAAGVSADSAHILKVFRADAWTPTALRLAVAPDRGEPSPADAGATLLLTPEDGVRLQGRPVTIVVNTNSLGVTQGKALAVALETDGPITWLQQPLPTGPGELRFDLPPSEGQAPTAIGFWIVSDKADYSYGTEIVSVRAIPS